MTFRLWLSLLVGLAIGLLAAVAAWALLVAREVLTGPSTTTIDAAWKVLDLSFLAGSVVGVAWHRRRVRHQRPLDKP